MRFKNIIKDIKKTKAPYIGKTLLRETDKKFYDMILEYMEKYNIIEKNKDEIIIYPTVTRLVGKAKDIEKDTAKQTSLFGGSNEL